MAVKSTTSGVPPERASGLARLWAEREPDRVAIRSEAGSVTYGRLVTSIRSTSATLIDQGLAPGDRLLIVSENSTATLVLFMASLQLGVIPAIVNARLSAAELGRIEGNARARRTIYLSASSPDAARHAREVQTTSITDDLWGEARIGPASSRSTTAQVPQAYDKRIACIAYTTGTTGAPKGVALSHEALMHMGRLSATPGETGSQAHYYLIAPLAHIIGLGSNLMAALWSGAAMEVVARFDINHLVEAITSRGITNLICVPTIYASLLSFARQRRIARIPNQLRSIRAGGAPLNVTLQKEIDSLLGLSLDSGYGMTECNAIARTWSTESPLGSIGRPNEGVRIRILGSQDSVADCGEIGKLQVSSPCMALGLWQEGRLADLPDLVDGWLDTGDLARVDAQGNLFLVGRSKEIIIRSGFNVAPAEIEQVICRHEAVVACAIVGCARLYDEIQIVAFVVVTPGTALPTRGELEQHCRQELAGYKCPSHFLFIDAIPQLPNGKVDRQSLIAAATRELAESQQ